MRVSPSSSVHYAFGPFVLDPIKRVLRRDGQPVPMTAKSFEVLLVLVERHGQVVGKDEIFGLIWPDTFVQENNLVRQISTVRRALDERPDQHDYLVTIPGQGYQFVAHVDEHHVGTPAIAVSASETETLAPAPAALPPESEPTERPQPRWPIAAALGLAATMVWIAMPHRAARETDVPPTRSLTRVTYDGGLQRQSSWSPDGQWVAYTSDRAGSADIWKQRVDEPVPTRLTHSDAQDSDPAWSPDGRSIAFRSSRDDGGLFLMNADGGAARRLTTFGAVPRWSPDGATLLFQDSSEVSPNTRYYLLDVAAGSHVPLRPDLVGERAVGHAAWHPDGRHVSLWTRSGQRWSLSTVPIDSGPARLAVLDEDVEERLRGLTPGRFVWTASRQFIFLEATTGDARNIWRVTLDPIDERWVQGPERLTMGISEDIDLALSPDGARLLFTTRVSRDRLWAFPFDSVQGRVLGPPQPITTGGIGDPDIDTSPDGLKLAYRAVRGSRSELWERTLLDGRERLLISSDDSRLERPRWSRNGVRLAYLRVGKDSPAPALAVFDSAGNSESILSSSTETPFVPTDWSRDSTLILGACRPASGQRFGACIMPVADDREAPVNAVRVIAADPDRHLYNQQFSPDQRWLVFRAVGPNSRRSTIYVAPVDGGAWVSVSDELSFNDKPRWSPDGRVVYFVSDRTGVSNVWARRFDPAKGRVVGEAFLVTQFHSSQFMLTSRLPATDIAVTETELFLPITESHGEVWMLDGVDR